MILKELNLIGFGKFKNKDIQFKDGINLIYGENESGKSTLHSFIDGMFYGFLKPNAKSTIYSEEHDKYNPWDKSKYAGIIRFEYNGKTYRIERTFSKGSESTIVLDENTGSDITKNIDVGTGKILQPGIHFFGFNSRIFSNTISIKQLATKTEDKLANEVTEKLVNVATTLDDSISVDNAISHLKVKMGEIGTDKAPTKPYARNLKDIEVLQEEKRKILEEKNGYEDYLEKESILKDNLLLEEENLLRLREELAKAETLERAKKLEEAKILTDEIGNLETKVEKLSIYSNISMEQYKESIKLSNSIDFIEKDIAELKSELYNIEEDLKSRDLAFGENRQDNEIEEISNDYSKYEELEEEKNSISYNKEDHKLEFLKRDYKDYKSKVSKHKLFQFALIILSIIVAAIGIVSNYYIIFAIIVGFMPMFGYSAYRANAIKSSIEDINTQINNIQTKETERLNKINSIEKLQDSLLNKNKVQSKMEFKRLLESIKFDAIRRKNNKELYNSLILKKNSLSEKITSDEFNKEENLKLLDHIFEENKVQDINEFSYALDKRALREKYIGELESKEEILRSVLGGVSIKGLMAEIGEFNFDRINISEIMDKNQAKYKIERANENITDLKISLKGVEENLNILSKNIERLAAIEEELDRKAAYKEELENKYNALDIAAQTIEELSKDIHSQFAPDINRKVSNIIHQITNGKYTNVKISESLGISVENPITKEIIPLNSLSGGTIDQLYFSLRFGIINSMVENNFPLILDDCFIQYDDIRLRNIMKFLDTIGNERQVILFSCHNRERKLLDDLAMDFNYIDLT
ncbi:AAA family ATPase [Tissierella sp.]|uniref:ATP-binding protein n=1 Tax=Tissierella sp. TaxID=41274 RepID=UPI002861D41D|nr:AAA family ATPase [Tissierella sp.]MDR7855808.1 AAA family ATPase [Tissierella sp.]